MAKKRPNENHHDHQEEVASDVTSEQTQEVEQTTEAESSSSPESSQQLMDEIQSFMNLREELSRKLAAEIEALELKLEELKQTAASLFPQGSDFAEEKKVKKAKPKPPKEEKPRVEAPLEQSEAA